MGKKQGKNNQRVMTYKLLCATVTFALAVWAITLGWFSENKVLNTDGTQLQSAGVSFMIASADTDGGYDSLFADGTNGESVLSKGAQTQFYVYGDDSDPITGYISGDSSTIWEMTSEANFNNADISDDSTAKDIAPGRWGYVDFYIIPITTGSIDISCEIDLTAYGSGDSEKLMDEEKATDKIVSGNTEYYPLSLTSDEDFDSLLKGHLMFFTEDSQSEDGSLKWLSPDENGKLSFEVCGDITEDYKVTSDDSDLQGYKAVRVRIYWVWASVFGQTVLDGNSLSVLEGNYKPVSQLLSEMAGEGLADEDIVKSEFQRLMAEDSAYRFFFLSEDRTSVEDSKNSGLGLNGTAMNAKSYNVLKQAWNSADQLIGNNVSFVTVELTASEATS